MQTAMLAVSVRDFYVQIAAVNVWAETVFLVADLIMNYELGIMNCNNFKRG